MGKTRIVFIEEWPSLRANKVLPYLTEKIDIIYLTSNRGIFPQANFKEVILVPSHKTPFRRAWQFSKIADRLYSDGKIDFACVYSSIAFNIKKTPFINLMGGSYYDAFKVRDINLRLYMKPILLKGLIHYVLPEYLACKRASRVISISKSLGKQLVDTYGITSDKVSVVYNGIDKNWQDVYTKKKFELAGDILYTGRLHYGKGILAFVEEFTKRKSIDKSFYIVGDGPDYENIRRIALQDSRIQLMGHLSEKELLEIMALTSYYVFPSMHEGFGNSLLEAMAAGHVCFAYNIPIMQEVLGSAGVLVSAGQPFEMCDELEKMSLKKDIVKSLAESAFQRTKAFSWTKCAKELESEFNMFEKSLHIKTI